RGLRARRRAARRPTGNAEVPRPRAGGVSPSDLPRQHAGALRSAAGSPHGTLLGRGNICLRSGAAHLRVAAAAAADASSARGARAGTDRAVAVALAAHPGTAASLTLRLRAAR